MYGHIHIEAGSWDEAIEIAEDDSTSLPSDGDYVDEATPGQEHNQVSAW